MSDWSSVLNFSCYESSTELDDIFVNTENPVFHDSHLISISEASEVYRTVTSCITGNGFLVP